MTTVRLATRVRQLDAAPDLLELVTSARDAGIEAMLVENPQAGSAGVAGIGRVLDVVSIPGGAGIEDGAGHIVDRATDHSRLRAAADLIARLAAAATGRVLAVGGFAFDPDRDPAAPWRGFPGVLLRVPELTLLRAAGRTTLVSATAVAEGDDAHAIRGRLDRAEAMLHLQRTAYRAPAARALAAEPVRPPAEWTAAVADAAAGLARGDGEKVVLARELVARGDGVVDAGSVLRTLRAAYPSCFSFLIPGADGTALVGATPELLVRRTGSLAQSQPMAGSAARGGDAADDDRLAGGLLASPKDRHEHEVVVRRLTLDYLAAGALDVAASDPEVVRFANIQHIATNVWANFVPGAAPSVLHLCAALHPTAAVCGEPRDVALETIARLEGMERGWYTGAVGWLDGSGDGEFAVTLRCGLLWEDGARLFAGVGVMADSNPAAELAETELKFSALLVALGG